MKNRAGVIRFCDFTLYLKDKGNKTRNLLGNPINGCFGIPTDKDVSVILETCAESIKQITCFPTSLLDIKGTRTSRATRILTNYLVKKIQGLKGNRKGINTMLFSTIEKELGITDYFPAKKSRVYNAIIRIVQSCKEKGQIKDYEVIIDGKNFYSIKLAWEGASKKKNVRNGTKRGNKVRSRKSLSVFDAHRQKRWRIHLPDLRQWKRSAQNGHSG